MESNALAAAGWTPQTLETVERLRGWTPEAIERLGLRYDRKTRRVVIPVHDETGLEVGALRYQPKPNGSAPKMVADAGTTRELFPPPEMIGNHEIGEFLWLVEGEPDAVRMWSLGIPAVGVPGVQNWRDEWAPRFHGRRCEIVVCFDCDEPGRTYAARAANALFESGVDVRVVDLDPSLGDGHDVTDFAAAATTPELRSQAARLLGVIAADSPPTTGVSIPFPYLVRGKEFETAARVVGNPSLSLPFGPLGAKLANVPDEPEWLWRGWVCPTVLTLVAGLPKVGKSTLLFGLLRALRDGAPFLGGPTAKARALVLTEEREMTLAQKRALFELGGDDLHALMRYEARDADWFDVVAQATAYALDAQLDILIVDTIDKWMPLVGESAENDAGATVRNLLPLMDAASAGLAIVVVTHHRKSDGKHGERVRGTTALTGAADVILELERAKGAFGDQGGRVISGTSRFPSTPESLAVELTDGAFVTVGSAEEAEARVQQASILVVLNAASEPRSRDEITEALVERGESIRGETLSQRLAELTDKGALVRSGGGKKGNPYRWETSSGTNLSGAGKGGKGISGAA